MPRKLLMPAIAAIVAAALIVALPRPARAFGDHGAFDPRILLAGGTTGAARPSAPGRWSHELVMRTSAPARSRPTQVRADDPDVVSAPFLYWSGDVALTPLTTQEIAGLRRFFALGGLLVVDDAGASPEGEKSEFGRTARAQIARVLPDSAIIQIGPEHVIFKSFYLLHRAEGRVLGTKTLDAIVRGGNVQVIFTNHDLGGALAQGATGVYEFPVVPGGDAQRDHAVRLAVNIAMYLLCSTYKDDQVHAPFLMRRRTRVPSASVEP
jgi:hypothetical protein